MREGLAPFFSAVGILIFARKNSRQRKFGREPQRGGSESSVVCPIPLRLMSRRSGQHRSKCRTSLQGSVRLFSPIAFRAFLKRTGASPSSLRRLQRPSETLVLSVPL